MSNLTLTRPPKAATPTEQQRPPMDLGQRIYERMTEWLARHSIAILRVSLGLVFLGFAALKYVPGASPAEDLVIRTVDTLTFGIVSGQAAMVATAVVETFIGLTLITGRWLKVGLVVMGGALVGMMSPLVLFFGDMFSNTPTLEAQYILKDIILIAAGLVIAARTLGARFVTGNQYSDHR